MVGVSAFVSKVKNIASRNLTYKTGGTGKNGVCDCIGLIMGAMYELGHKKYDLHSTNYFARYQMQDLTRVSSEKELFVGQLLFRSRSNTAKLNARYQPGGSHYTGDLLDYYHVAVVTRTKPLEIIECTEYGSVTGIVVNTRLKDWQYGGRLKGVLYDGYDEEDDPAIDVVVPATVLYKAVVTTEKDPLSVREWPQTGPIIGRVPKGRIVDVLSNAGDGWPEIRYNELVGVASEKYLTRTELPAEPQETIETTDEAQAASVTIVDSAGNRFRPVGDFKVYLGGID